MEQPKIFISYSREDMGLVRQIRDHVVSVTGLQCWMDTNAVESSTKQFAKDIINNINNSDVFLFMLSNHSQQSEVVLRELDFATKKGKHVVIVNADDCTMTNEFQFLYGLTDTIRWSDVAQRRKLLGDLKRWVGASGPEQERLGDEGQDAERWAKEEQEEQERRIREAERSKYNQRRKGKIEQKIAGEAAKRTKEGTPGEAVSETERRAKEEALREASEEDDPKPKKKILLWVIIGVVAVLIAVFLYLRWYMKPIPDPPQPTYGSIVLDCTPDSAKLYVNGQEKGFTPITVSQLLPGGYEIRLTKEGYIDYVDSIKVVARIESDTVKIALQPIPKPKEEESDQNEVDLEDEPNDSDNDLTFDVKGTSFTMKFVEGGTFMMGAQKTNSSGQNYDSEAGDDESPVHSVTLSNYYIAETEVTQALWVAVMGSNPSYFKGDDLPVECVSWKACQVFIRKLNQRTGKNFRLPTEAEWEYAARGGKMSKGYKYAGSNSIGNIAWYDDNSSHKTYMVKTKSPNELGLYDMTGNVWEWCSDRYGSDYYSKSPSSNPTGPSSDSYRVRRGGSCDDYARYGRVSDRSYDVPDVRYRDLGFRLALPQ